MTLCSDNHDEVCYESRDCPACKLYVEKTDLEAEVKKLKDEVDNLESQLP